MIIDMHVHTSDGSMDGKINIFDTVDILKSKGFDGMLITDHNSYYGYSAWVRSGRTDFKVFKGIEYDTADAGHMLVVVPSGLDTSIYKLRGLKVNTLLDIVHTMGGVVGAAHPYDYKRLGIGNIPRWDTHTRVFKQLDFIEGFNSGGSKEGNKASRAMAYKYKKPVTAGSDSHRKESVGLAGTVFESEINTESELIAAIKSNSITKADGEYYDGYMHKHKAASSVGLIAFYGFSKIVSLIRRKKRNRLLEMIITQWGEDDGIRQRIA